MVWLPKKNTHKNSRIIFFQVCFMEKLSEIVYKYLKQNYL